MTSGDPVNRREQPRIARRLPVRFGTEAKMCGGTAVDVSEGGMRVIAPEGFPVNSLVDVFVQFPGQAIRLRAKVVWVGTVTGSPAMGLAFTSPTPSLTTAYKRWLAEVKDAAAEASASIGDAAGAKSTTPSPAESRDASPAPEPVAEPEGPVRRRLESPQGQAYDVLLEPHILGWRLQIVQLPHQPGVQAPDHDKTYADYAAAEKAMRQFVRAH
jgi:hypothetical protein